MKKLANLNGVKTLGKVQQKSIFGGEGTDTIGGGGGGVCQSGTSCNSHLDCPGSCECYDPGMGVYECR